MRRTTCVASAWQAYLRHTGCIQRTVHKHLGSLGAFVAARPWSVLITSLTVSLALTCGAARINKLIEYDGKELWCASHRRLLKQLPCNMPSSPNMTMCCYNPVLCAHVHVLAVCCCACKHAWHGRCVSS